uniref:Uncharacterized protein n=1 Tax=Setaria viridis TaxID=4556 RepID=A0A4U6W3V0_SETVI|nr:hypothetical protein SEVIR_1G022500v2 [Setaria viridis]
MLTNISFWRAIVGDKLMDWRSLVAKMSHFQLSNEKDIFTWGLHRTGNQYLINQGTPFTSYLQGNVLATILGCNEDTREIIRLASRAMEIVALDIFIKNGWRNNNKITLIVFDHVCVQFP